MAKHYYIAYGSNLNTEQMEFRCPTARPLGTAILRDRRLSFRGSKTGAYLTVATKAIPTFTIGRRYGSLTGDSGRTGRER